MKLFLSIVLVVLMGALSACEPKNTKPDVGVPSAKIDPSMLVQCPSLPVPDASLVWDLGKAITALTDLQGQYTECAVRNDCLINAVKDPTKVTSCPVVKKP